MAEGSDRRLPGLRPLPVDRLENIAYGDASFLESAEPVLTQTYLASGAKEFKGGAELSAGQWQRLATARAYLRDAQIVVLDEPTAAMDPRAEVEVYRQFRAAAAGRCAVFTSHRLGSARLADRIVVLKEGRIVATGTHDELLARDGEYARMYRVQASWYAQSDEEAAG